MWVAVVIETLAVVIGEVASAVLEALGAEAETAMEALVDLEVAGAASMEEAQAVDGNYPLRSSMHISTQTRVATELRVIIHNAITFSHFLLWKNIYSSSLAYWP